MRAFKMQKRLNAVILSTAGVVGLQLFVGCSLTSIPFVRVGECDSDASCNEALEAKCAEYECVATTDKKGESFTQCRKIEGERLDGLDNDCDGLIDNTGTGDSPLSSTQGEELVSGIGSFDSIALASSRALTEIYFQKGDGTALATPPEGGDAAPVTMMAQADDAKLQTALTEGCVPSNGGEPQSCNINQVAIAAGSKLGYFAQVTTSGCRQGELRVGAINPEAPDEFIDRGPTFRNPSYQGVATNGSPCTDNGRSECTIAKQSYAELSAEGVTGTDLDELRSTITSTCGVSRPSVAALEDQALVTFLGARYLEDVCETGSVDLFGLLLHGRTGLRNGEFYWTDPSADGVPQLLGTTISAQPPAVREIGELGFLMAHPEKSGELKLTFIPQQASPPGNGGLECPDGDCYSREGFETDPISGVEEIATLTTSGAADGVRMQWMSTGAEQGVLLLSWVRGCSPSADQLDAASGYAQALRLDVSGEVPEIIYKGDVINLGSTRSFPLAVPSQLEFVVEGLQRNGQTATENDLGGFFVLTRPLALQAVRVAAFDGAPVSKDELIPVDPFSGSPDSKPNTYRYLGAMGESSPDEFYLRTTGGGSLFRASFDNGN